MLKRVMLREEEARLLLCWEEREKGVVKGEHGGCGSRRGRCINGRESERENRRYLLLQDGMHRRRAAFQLSIVLAQVGRGIIVGHLACTKMSTADGVARRD